VPLKNLRIRRRLQGNHLSHLALLQRIIAIRPRLPPEGGHKIALNLETQEEKSPHRSNKASCNHPNLRRKPQLPHLRPLLRIGSHLEQLRSQEIPSSLQNPCQSSPHYPQTQRPQDLPAFQDPTPEQVLTWKRPIATRHNPIWTRGKEGLWVLESFEDEGERGGRGPNPEKDALDHPWTPKANEIIALNPKILKKNAALRQSALL
jgi:hypothetical protein